MPAERVPLQVESDQSTYKIPDDFNKIKSVGAIILSFCLKGKPSYAEETEYYKSTLLYLAGRFYEVNNYSFLGNILKLIYIINQSPDNLLINFLKLDGCKYTKNEIQEVVAFIDK